MLLKDFFFSFKNSNISLINKKKKLKIFGNSLSFLYKFIILDRIVYNFFRNKNLDKYNKDLINRNLKFLFEFFNSYKVMHGYDDIYEKNFFPLKNNKLNLLEIGTAKGDGLASFFYYFKNSNFVGIDNNPFKIKYKSKKLRNIYGDISSKKVLSNLSEYLDDKFDIIIEDCSHKLIDQILCFSFMFNNLKSGGYYIVEDLNFPEIDAAYNPTNEDLSLKSILIKINENNEFNSKFLNIDQIKYLKNNIESINFLKGKDERTEIVLIKKK